MDQDDCWLVDGMEEDKTESRETSQLTMAIL